MTKPRPGMILFLCALLCISTQLEPATADIGGGTESLTTLQRLEEEARRSHSDALLIQQGGRTILDYSSADAPELIELMSVTKSVVALALGRLQTQKKISMKALVADFYPEWRQGLKASVSLEHLLSHTSGLQHERHTEEIYRAPDFVQLALAAELITKPGEEFSYNNKAVNLLAGIVQKVAGESLDSYVEKEIFGPLGITEYRWAKDQAGNPHAMSGLQLKPEDLVKIGQLVLAEGRWQGKQILSQEWLEAAFGPQGDSYCGYLWWRLPEKEDLVIDSQSVSHFLEKYPEATCARQLIGRYSDREELQEALSQVIFSQELWAQKDFVRDLNQGLVKIERKGLAGYAALGYLGQYLLVFPDKDLIVVRMVANSDAYDSATDGFDNLLHLVREL